MKRHVIHHCVTVYARKDGREHSTCCGRNLCIGPTVWSQYSISLRTYHPLTFWDVIDQCWPECGVFISSTSYSGFYLSLVQLIAWAEDTYIGLTLRLLIVSSTLRSKFSPSDENIQLETLGEEFELAESIWWGETTILWVLDYEMHWHCEDNGHIFLILFVWKFCDEMFRYCEDNTYIIVIVIYRSDIWSWSMTFIASKNDDLLRQLWSSHKDNIVLKQPWFTL